MKKIFLCIIMITVLATAAGCGQTTSPAPGFGQEDVCLNIAGTTYSLNSNIETVTQSLGSDYAYSEAISCDYDGLDKTYQYDMALFYTYPLPEGDLVNEIYTESPEVSTSKGITIGATKEEVLSLYGEECEDTGYQLIYRLSDSGESADKGALCFDMEDGVVKAIYITAAPV